MTGKIETRYQSTVPFEKRDTDIASLIKLMNKIDINPKEIQRQFVAGKDPNWMPDFIADIFCGEDLGTVVISLQAKQYKVDWKGEEKTVQYKLLDAQQRLTMLWLFINDEVKVREKIIIFDKNKRPIDIGGMLWGDIERKYPDIADQFLSRSVTIKEYGEEDNYLNTKEESTRFKLIQAGFDLKPQEVRNCSKAMIAEKTRDDVRLEQIPLYGLLGKMDNTRMKVEEGRAMHIHYLIHKYKRIDKKTLDDLYEDLRLEDPGDECKVYSALYEKDIKVFKVLKPIEDMMAKILEDKQFYSQITTGYYHSLFFFCEVIIRNGPYAIDDIDELKWLFFQTHAELVLPNGNEGPLENETDFGHALSQIGSKKNMEYVVNTWTEELGLNEEE